MRIARQPSIENPPSGRWHPPACIVWKAIWQMRGETMTDSNDKNVSRREFVHGAVGGAVMAAAPAAVFGAAGSHAGDKAAVMAQIPGMHADNLKRLQDWIALPSIAAENRNYPQGAEYMAKLAKEAGFTDVKIIPHFRQARRIRPAGFRRQDHAGGLFHVRRQAVRCLGMEFAAARGAAGGEAGLGHRVHGPRCRQSERSAECLLERAAGLQGQRQKAAGESGAGVRGRGGNRLAALR